MMRKTTLFVLIVASVALLTVLARCGEPAPFESPMPAPFEASGAIQAVAPYTVSKTCMGIFYTDTVSVTVATNPYPLTMTCQLRQGGYQPGDPILAQQVYTWSVPVAITYTTAPVVEPFCIVWSLTQTLPAGWIEEHCQLAIPGFHYGWLPGEYPDGDHFFMTTHWLEEAGSKTYLPGVMKAWPR